MKRVVIISIKIKVLPDKKKEFLQTIESLIISIKEEHGCLNATHYERVGSQGEFLLMQEWLTRENAETHLQSDAFMVLRGAASLLSESPEIIMQSVERSEVVTF